ncbi:MAG: deoxynucleoside kinase [Candidatus Eiseniibacteriota bacterium]|nr:MAG: deoxynucleoside kinase [Candidatus Eisenbacteria bacterium]
MALTALEKNYIAIEGVIGVGKTSLATMIAEKLDARLVLEEAETNPFLEDFYKDRRGMAFQVQVYFLLSRYQQQKELIQRDLFFKRTVSDYIFQKDRIFANVNLDDREFALYDRIASILEQEIAKPDIVIYLQATPEVLMRRIQKRARSSEKPMELSYIQTLNEAYNYFFFHYTDAPVLAVNTTEIDFVNNPEYVTDLLKRVEEHDDGVLYYTPLGGKGEE